MLDSDIYVTYIWSIFELRCSPAASNAEAKAIVVPHKSGIYCLCEHLW